MSDKPLTMDDAFASMNAVLDQMPVRQMIKKQFPDSAPWKTTVEDVIALVNDTEHPAHLPLPIYEKDNEQPAKVQRITDFDIHVKPELPSESTVTKLVPTPYGQTPVQFDTPNPFLNALDGYRKQVVEERFTNPANGSLITGDFKTKGVQTHFLSKDEVDKILAMPYQPLAVANPSDILTSSGTCRPRHLPDYLTSTCGIQRSIVDNIRLNCYLNEYKLIKYQGIVHAIVLKLYPGRAPINPHSIPESDHIIFTGNQSDRYSRIIFIDPVTHQRKEGFKDAYVKHVGRFLNEDNIFVNNYIQATIPRTKRDASGNEK